MRAQEVCIENKPMWASLRSRSLLLLEDSMPVEDIICMLDRCRREKDRECALCLHTFMSSRGLDGSTGLGNRLLSLMMEVGSLCHAQKIFDRLVCRDEESWNILISGYIKYGELQHAFTLYHGVEKDSNLCLGAYTFMALLKAAIKFKDLERGCRLHAKIDEEGLLLGDAFLGSTLIEMYIKCGSLTQAQEVFDKILIRNTYLWNVLLAGYANTGCEEEALNCFRQMQQEGIPSDAVTCVCILKICSSRMDVGTGQEIHVKIVTQGLEEDGYIRNTLVDLYAKCSLLQDAMWVFESLLVKDVVSWNALIAGHASQEHGEKALHYMGQMQQEGVLPQAVTFVLSLKACGMISDIKKGQQIHSAIASLGLLEKNVFVGSAMVDMYAKCGAVLKAREVFDSLPIQNVVSWNSLMTGYMGNEYCEEALHCVEQMRYEGIFPSNVTLMCSLKACGSIGASIKGQEIHAEMIQKGLEGELIISSALVDMYARCGFLAEAQIIFDKYSMRGEVSWTSLMAGYEEHECAEEALRCYEQMEHAVTDLGAITLNCALKACASLGAICKGQQIHAESARKGFLEKDILVGSTLVDMYAKCGLLAKAQELFDKLPGRDIVVWTALMAGYLEHGYDEEALNCFEDMQRFGTPVDAFSFVLSLKACTNIGAAVEGQTMHAQIVMLGLEQELVIGSTLVVMYAKCGWLADSQHVFDKLPVADVVLWSALIAGYAELGESGNVMRLFNHLIEGDMRPDSILFVSVLNACSHGGCVDEGQFYFVTMCKEHGFVPNFEHLICMIDLYCRAGQLDKVNLVINSMPFHPSLVAWHAVLAACRKWGDVGFGKGAFEHAVSLDEQDVSVYVLMYNIYGDAAAKLH